MSALLIVVVGLSVVLWPVDSWLIVRLGRANTHPYPLIGWIPFVRTQVVAHSAELGWLSWLCSQIPIVGAYIQWDWWEDIADDLHLPRSGLKALGIVLVPGLRTYLMYRVVQASEARNVAPELRGLGQLVPADGRM